MPPRKPPKKDPAAWDKLVDGLFELDKTNPYLGQTIEPRAASPRPTKPPVRKPRA